MQEVQPEPDLQDIAQSVWFDGEDDGFAGRPPKPPDTCTTARELYLDGYAVGDQFRHQDRERAESFEPAFHDSEIPF